MKPLFLLLLYFVPPVLYAQQDTAYRNRVEFLIDTIENSGALTKHEIKRGGIVYGCWLYKNSLFKIKKHWSEKTAENNVLENDLQYYLDKGKLIKAFEREVLLVNGNRDDVSVWSATTYFKNGQLYYITSLGHGKTEDEQYDMEKETLKNFQQLKAILRKQLKQQQK
ncbi:hypothetical protein [Niabella beijingensis]|uniref:hypothetical protein n=1 Tax=Niabella beijingensis TaxID=2872700 RepID=UPI001CBE0645|nr:hypothetical protein [Niabella beijingensis]MBZ4187320.1 hypothetical protein [Niabella beijingensis]